MLETRNYIIRHFENRDLGLAASLSKKTAAQVIDLVGATYGVFNDNLYYSFERKEDRVLEGIIAICDIDYRSKHAVIVCTPLNAEVAKKAADIAFFELNLRCALFYSRTMIDGFKSPGNIRDEAGNIFVFRIQKDEI